MRQFGCEDLLPILRADSQKNNDGALNRSVTGKCGGCFRPMSFTGESILKEQAACRLENFGRDRARPSIRQLRLSSAPNFCRNARSARLVCNRNTSRSKSASNSAVKVSQTQTIQ